MNFFNKKERKKLNNQVNSKQERAFILFERMPIKKAIWIVALPSLMISFMVGLYTFVNQYFILNYVPQTINILDPSTADHSGILYSYLPESLQHIKINQNDFTKLYQIYNAPLAKAEHLNKLSGDTIASVTINASLPFATFSNAIVFLIPIGTSVYYTKCISKNVEQTGKDLWSTGFYSTIALSLISTLIMYIAIWSGLVSKVVSPTKFQDSALAALNVNDEAKIILAKYGAANLDPSQIFTAYYTAGYNISQTWANQYIYIFGAGTVIQGIYVLLSYLIRSEGKNSYVMIWAIIANLVGAGMDAVLIIVFKTGVIGGVVASIIGWVVNLGAYLVYLIINNKKESTWLIFRHLIHFKFRYKFLLPITLLGSSAFLRTFGVAVGAFVITLILGRMPFAEASTSIYNWSKATPVLTLFFLAIFGIADGSRAMLSYNYAKKNVKRTVEVYKWALLISFIYAISIYILVAALAPYFVFLLNAKDPVTGGVLGQNSGPVVFLRLNMFRLAVYAFATGGILLFQGTGNIKMSAIVSGMEGFITFWFVMGLAIGIGFALHNNGVSSAYAQYVIPAAYAGNALVASLIIAVISYRFIKFKLPNEDGLKIPWSKRLENEFFRKAEIYEIEYKANLVR